MRSGPFEVLTIAPHEMNSCHAALSADEVFEFIITRETQVTFLAHAYRLVFMLDVSPSMATVGLAGQVAFDMMAQALETTLTNLVQPICLPGSPVFVFLPNIHISVLAQTAPLSQVRLILKYGLCIL